MNYLAHIFLSGTNGEILIGNFIGDYVKGRDYTTYPPLIKKGILLHRRIDSFTDRHKIIRQSKSYFAPRYHKYAGIIIDVLYDHFLARNWEKFSPTPLEDYKQDVFDVLKKNYAILPERVQFFLPSFIKNDWIEIYSSVEGILSVFIRMSMRTTLPDHSEFTREVLRKYYIQLESEFLTYFPDVINYVINKHEITIPLKDNSILDLKTES
jgi:acyl carrier protein phosphodiesterase